MKKLGIGCGIVVVVLLGVLAFGIYQFGRWARDAMPDMEAFATQRAELVDSYGAIDSYVPPTDGVYDPERVARYVDLRVRCLERARPLIADADAELDRPVGEKPSGVRGMFTQFRGAISLIGRAIEYVAYTDSMLIAAEMGRGEFAHYHLVLLNGWYDLETARQDWMRQMARMHRESDGDHPSEAADDLLRDFDDRMRDVLDAQFANLETALANADDDSSIAWLDRARGRDGALPFTDPVPLSLRAAFDAHAIDLRATVPRTVASWLAESAFVLEADELDSSRTQRVSVEF